MKKYWANRRKARKSQRGPMELPQQTAAEQLAHERDLLKRLRAWYIAPGRQRDLLKV